MSRTSIQRLADDAPVAHADSWPARRPPSVAYDAACDALEAQAVRNVVYLIKGCARAYALQPHELDAIATGLSNLSPRDRITVLKQLRAIQKMRGGREVINLKAAMLHARLARRAA